MKISGYILTKNNARSLPWALESVQGMLDELVIVDSGSTDETLDIARKYTDRIYYKELVDFADQRNYAISLCKGDWVYTMDADEVMGENFSQLFQYLDGKYRAILIPRYNLVGLNPTAFLKKPHYSDWQVRVFRNDGQCYYDTEHKVHHQLRNCRPRLKVPFVNIFHLHFLLHDYAARKERVDFYEKVDPGSGGSEYYLFEDYPETTGILETIETILPEVQKQLGADAGLLSYPYQIDCKKQVFHKWEYELKKWMTQGRYLFNL